MSAPSPPPPLPPSPSTIIDDGSSAQIPMLPPPTQRLRCNPRHAPWIIQKFGGTSLGKFAPEIVDEIVQPGITTHRIAIVCSARSTGTKAEGTTSRLLRAASATLTPGSSHHIDIVAAIRKEHITAASSILFSQDLLAKFVVDVDAECEILISFLSAAQVLNEISCKTRDTIVGAGEKLSCLFMTAVLKDRGIDAEYVNLENIIHRSVESKDLTQAFYDRVGNVIAERLLDCEDRVPVITGYFGTVPGSLLDAIGRGYTDLCAALLAVGISAAELQVWKEVDGIFTADPRKVAQAQLIPVITPEETAELTYWGSEVIHPFTMEQAIRASIPIRIKNVTKPNGSGTVICPDAFCLSSSCSDSSSTPGTPPLAGLRPSVNRPTAVTTKSNITVINVRSNRKNLSHGFLAKIFKILDDRRLTVDLISTSEVHVTMAMHTDTPMRRNAAHIAARDLEAYGSVDVIHGLTILAVVGKHMKQMVGIAGRMFQTLAESGVNIEMISQGSNEINISCVIKEQDALKAMTILHTKLFLYGQAENVS